MASGAFYSRVEVKPTGSATGHLRCVLLPGDHVVTYCGDGSRVGEIERFETHEKFTAGSCVTDTVDVAFVRDLKTGEISEAMPHLLKLDPNWTPPLPDFDADNDYGVRNYFRQRSKLLSARGWEEATYGPRRLGHWGYLATYYRVIRPDDPQDSDSVASRDIRFAVYVLKSHRKRGHLKRYLEQNPSLCFITLDDCGVEEFYKRHERDVLVIPTGQV